MKKNPEIQSQSGDAIIRKDRLLSWGKGVDFETRMVSEKLNF